MYREEQVRQGIALLDAKLPGWHETFDPSTLDIGRMDSCVLAQASGSHNYVVGLLLVGLTAREALDYGFAAGYGVELLLAGHSTWVYESAELTRTWIILEREVRFAKISSDLSTQPPARELVLV